MTRSPADKTRERAEDALKRSQRDKEEARVAQANAKQWESQLKGRWKKQCDELIGAAMDGLCEAKFAAAIIYPSRLLSTGFEIIEFTSYRFPNKHINTANEFVSALDASIRSKTRNEVISSANRFYSAAKSSLGRDFYGFQRFEEEFPKNLDWLVNSNTTLLDFLITDYFGREFQKVYNGPYRTHIIELINAYDDHKKSLKSGAQRKEYTKEESEKPEKTIVRYVLSSRTYWPDFSKESYFDKDRNENGATREIDESSLWKTVNVDEDDEELFPQQTENELVVRWANQTTCTEHLNKPLMSPEGLAWVASNFRRKLMKTVVDTLDHHADHGCFPTTLELSYLGDAWFVRDHQGMMRASCLPEDLSYLIKTLGYRVTSSGRSKGSRMLMVK